MNSNKLCKARVSTYLTAHGMTFKKLLCIMWIVILILIDVFCLSQGEIVAGLILARGGSKGVRLKNLQKVGGVSLVQRAVTIARAAGLADVTVATDHPLIALEAIRSNASLFHRSPVTATDWAPSIWGVAEFLAHRPDIETLVLLQATSPFVKPFQIRGAMIKLNTPVAYDCVFSVTRSYKLRWHFRNGRLQPLNFDVNLRPRRQDMHGEMTETGSFYITRSNLLHEGKFQNNNCTVWEVSTVESLEVDTHFDLQLAKVLHEANIV